jgi:hypothetical protein
MSISPIAQGFLKFFWLQHVALAVTVRRPKHPYLARCILIFLYENLSRLVPRNSNWGHHTAVYTAVYTHVYCVHKHKHSSFDSSCMLSPHGLRTRAIGYCVIV